ncbi:MAG: hypothetical protein WA667_06195, partial [Candidatus Nitrosopolaris sp.]
FRYCIAISSKKYDFSSTLCQDYYLEGCTVLSSHPPKYFSLLNPVAVAAAAGIRLAVAVAAI